jgi:hypothetical protein
MAETQHTVKINLSHCPFHGRDPTSCENEHCTLSPFMADTQHHVNINLAHCPHFCPSPNPNFNLIFPPPPPPPPLIHEPHQPFNLNHAHSSHLCQSPNTHWCTVTAGTSTTYIKEAADGQDHPTPINVATFSITLCFLPPNVSI